MSWQAKLWFFNSGSAVILALVCAAVGSALCFVFGLAAAFYWHMGNMVIERMKEGE